MLKYLCIVCTLVLGLTTSYARQHPRIDSLIAVLDTVNAAQRPHVQLQLALVYEVYAPLDTTQAYCLHVLKTLPVNRYPTVGVELLALTAYTYMQQGYNDSAMHYHRREYQLAHTHQLYREAGIALSRIGMMFNKHQQYDSALSYSDSALALVIPLNEPVSTFKVHVHRGMIANYMNDHVAAQKHYLEALKAAKLTKNNRYLASAYSALVDIADNLDLIDEQLQYAKKFYQLAANTKEMPDWGLAHEELAGAYLANKMNDSALVYLKKVIPLYQQYNMPVVSSRVQYRIGLCYQNQGKFSQALVYFKKAVAIAKSQPSYDGYSIDYMLYVIGFAHIWNNEHNQAIPYLQESIERAPANDHFQRWVSYKSLAQAYKTTKQPWLAIQSYDSSMHYSELHHKQKAKELNAETNAEINRLKIQFETQEKEQEIQLLTQKQKVDQQIILRQRLLQAGLVVLAILLLLVGALIYRSRRRAITDKEAIAQQKEEIEAQAEELQTSNERLVALDYFKKKTMGMIVHDLKNPLNLIYNSTDSKQVKQTAAGMMNLVLNLLQTQKLESTQLAIEQKPESMTELLQQAIEQVEYLAAQKHIRLQCNTPQNYEVLADVSLMVRVFVNLLTNAIKYSPLNNVVSINVKPATLHSHAQAATVTVTDVGPGISVDDQQHLFNAFATPTGRSTGIDPSTGLGLHFCLLVVQAHQGTIEVQSQLGKGTTMQVTLPAHLAGTSANGTNGSHLQNANLTEADLQVIDPFRKKLQQIAFYEYNKVAEVIDSMPSLNNPRLIQWQEAIMQSVLMSNQPVYESLVGG